MKLRLSILRGKGLRAAQKHLRYIQREGTTREGTRGELYGAGADTVDRSAWLSPTADDRHQFRLVIGAEDGLEYDDLKSLTRRLMARMEEDLGTALDWVAVDHYDTGHPHTHIVLRGRDDRGHDLIIARDYICYGIRERAGELVDLDLGPRSDLTTEHLLRADVTQERWTGIDSALIRYGEANIVATSSLGDAFDHAICVGRLKSLERFGLAHQLDASRWQLATDLEATLRRMGRRDDIHRTLRQACAALEQPSALADQIIYEPFASGARSLVGSVVKSELADETDKVSYLIIEATDGRSHYIDVGRAETRRAVPVGAVVHVAPAQYGVRQADLTIAEVAAANHGHYTIDAHMRHDRSIAQAVAEEHVRRLRAMQNLTHTLECEVDGAWVIPQDYLDKAAAFEKALATDRPVEINILSSVPLEMLIEAEAATWLDAELVAVSPEPLREAGFGRLAQSAKMQRRQWLVTQGLAKEQDGRTTFSDTMIITLRRRELLRVAGQLSDELALDFVEKCEGEKVEGRLVRIVNLTSGSYALIEKSREFTLVPWAPALERQIGKSVTGIVRGDQLSWTFGRERVGPSIG